MNLLKSITAALLILTCGLYTHLAMADGHGVYEIRTYVTNEGKLDALHTRFSEHTMRLFEKHGMRNVAYWTPIDSNDTLIYILEHDSAESAKASWDAFINDPEWQAVYAASIADGRLVKTIDNHFMTKTPYSP